MCPSICIIGSHAAVSCQAGEVYPGEFHPHVMRPPCVNLISWGLGGLFDYGDIDVDFVEFILWLLAVV